MSTKIHEIENRGTSDVPFGFVYIGDTRIGYDTVDGELHVWAAHGWPYPTRAQVRHAVWAVSGLINPPEREQEPAR